MNTIKQWTLLAFSLFFISSLWAQSSPVPVLEQAADEIIATLKKNKSQLKKNPAIIQQAVKKHLLPIVDVVGMSRSVLGRQAWNNATTTEKKQFMNEFTQLVIRTYSSPLAEYTDEKVKFLPMRGDADGRFAQVNSVIIRSNGQKIPLAYSVVNKNHQWKVYDLSVEGVSLLQSFRSQFGQILQNASMQDLIKQMRQHQAA